MKKALIQILLISVFISSCKKKESEKPLKIGDYHVGGTIFLLDQSGKHGLVGRDLEIDCAWGCDTTFVNGCSLMNLFEGSSNTNAIVSTCSVSAAKKCADIGWYLPSIVELETMAKHGICKSDLYFWSSTQADFAEAYAIYYGPKTWTGPFVIERKQLIKGSTKGVVAVKAF